ncbi:MAG: hypothetical protein IJH39_12610 [Clostridia bacterium]|nr:hypothetical protein [Clostridia bacterium]
MIDIYVGIDPSMNSSGVTCLAYEDGKLIREMFYIIKPDKLTKRENEAEQANLKRFMYVLYQKPEYDKENNHEVEYNKILIFKQILEDIEEVVKKFIHQITYSGIYNLYVCQEGISYGSASRTKSVFDLAGLNFLLRMMVITKLRPTYFLIATPSEIKKKTSGNGNCKKEVMIDLFKAIYSDFNLPKLDDIADSFWMASYVKNLHDEGIIE